ncbi:MAG: hypothetical protein CMD16_03120 [Flavobacteriales bacterium]|nr:hypothetical protein [Flavobacteriales bacterium]|tara:strand:- start:4551 stop:4925 length:375 start_codon:yes stop_codon:yes gene_type:complete
MKKIILIAYLLPLTNYAQDNIQELKKGSLNHTIGVEEVFNCQFQYILTLKKYSGLFMCPYLAPKMTTELNKIDACNINKNEESQIVSFELDTLYLEKDVQDIFLNIIGIPEWSITNIKTLVNEK